MDDRDRVRELLGREPRGNFEVAVRDTDGDPIVLRNDPFLDDGTPMPTRYWLIGKDIVIRVSRLEAAGGVRAAEAAIDPAAIADAHARVMHTSATPRSRRATTASDRPVAWAAHARASNASTLTMAGTSRVVMTPSDDGSRNGSTE